MATSRKSTLAFPAAEAPAARESPSARCKIPMSKVNKPRSFPTAAAVKVRLGGKHAVTCLQMLAEQQREIARLGHSFHGRVNWETGEVELKSYAPVPGQRRDEHGGGSRAGLPGDRPSAPANHQGLANPRPSPNAHARSTPMDVSKPNHDARRTAAWRDRAADSSAHVRTPVVATPGRRAQASPASNAASRESSPPSSSVEVDSAQPPATPVTPASQKWLWSRVPSQCKGPGGITKKEALRLIDEVHGDVNLAEKGILRGLRELSLLTKEEEAELSAREPYTFEDGTNGTAMPSIAEEGGR